MTTQQEQTDALLSQLIATLTQYANTGNWQPWPFSKGYTQCCLDWTLAEKALKAIPAELLEREQKREAVILAAIEYIKATNVAIINDEENRFEDLHKAVDALGYE